MTVEQALEELEKRADEFAIMEDNFDNRDEFLNSWKKVYDLFEYIANNMEVDPNSGELDSRFLEANNIVENISVKNPALENWVEKILCLNSDTNL